MNISVILSTYNGPQFLGLVLLSLKLQTQKNFELIIADDGSTQETTDLINYFKKDFPVEIIHLWQEDLGFRKSKIHNEAIRKSRGEFLIFLDGDCIVHKDFVKDHWDIYQQNASHPYVFMGRRVELGEKITQRINRQNVQQLLLQKFSWSLFFSCLTLDSRNFFRSFSIKNSFLRWLLKSDKVPDLLGCNFSLAKKTFTAVNGFNEDFVEYWGEDGDVFVRLRNYGCKLIGKKSFAVQFHLYHPRRIPGKGSQKQYFKLLAQKDYVWAQNGLLQSSH